MDRERARVILYLKRFWTRFNKPGIDVAARLALLQHAANAENWPETHHEIVWNRRWAFQSNYDLFLVDIEEVLEAPCQLCRSAPWRNKHHIVPLQCGGINDDLNLIALCVHCHTAIHPHMQD